MGLGRDIQKDRIMTQLHIGTKQNGSTFRLLLELIHGRSEIQAAEELV